MIEAGSNTPRIVDYSHLNFFMNGIDHSFEQAKEHADKINEIIKNHFGENRANCILLYNGTTPTKTSTVNHIIHPFKVWNNKIELSKWILENIDKNLKDKPHVNINIFAHSQGAHIVEKAMKELKGENSALSRINVVFLGGVASLKNDSGNPNLFFDVLDPKDGFAKTGRVTRIGHANTIQHAIPVENKGENHHSCEGYLDTDTVRSIIKLIANSGMKSDGSRYDIKKTLEKFPNVRGTLVKKPLIIDGKRLSCSIM